MDEYLERTAATNKQQFALIYNANKARLQQEKLAELEAKKLELLQQRERR